MSPAMCVQHPTQHRQRDQPQPEPVPDLPGGDADADDVGGVAARDVQRLQAARHGERHQQREPGLALPVAAVLAGDPGQRGEDGDAQERVRGVPVAAAELADGPGHRLGQEAQASGRRGAALVQVRQQRHAGGEAGQGDRAGRVMCRKTPVARPVTAPESACECPSIGPPAPPALAIPPPVGDGMLTKAGENQCGTRRRGRLRYRSWLRPGCPPRGAAELGLTCIVVARRRR